MFPSHDQRGGATIVINRPRFPVWQLQFTIEFNEDLINEKDLILAIDTAGKIHGIGAYRPRYGRFNIIDIKRFPKENDKKK